jgi:hypothetical protein
MRASGQDLQPIQTSNLNNKQSKPLSPSEVNGKSGNLSTRDATGVTANTYQYQSVATDFNPSRQSGSPLG